MRKQVIFFSFFFSFLFFSQENSDAAVPSNLEPSVVAIMKKVWANMKWEPFSMAGILRTQEDRYPLILKTKPYEIEYEIKTEWPQYIRVALQSKGSRLFNRSNLHEEWQEMPSSNWNQAVLNTDLTYEQLALDFLTWPKIEAFGRDNFKTMPAYLLEAFPEGRNTSYSRVRFWISQEYFVLVRADFYNAKNQVIKRLEMNAVQKIGDFWFLKELQISTRMPDRDLSKSRSYLEIQKAEALTAETN